MTEAQQKLLDNIFPEEYQAIMSENCKLLFCGTFISILKNYPDTDELGFRYRINSGKKQEIRRLFPRLKDLKQPYINCPLDKLKAIIILPEPYNNGESTGIPLDLIKFNSPDYGKYKPLARISDTQQNIDCFEEYVGLNFNDSYPFCGRVDFFNMLQTGVLFIHSSLTSEEKVDLAHFKAWYPFTIEFIKCLIAYKPTLVVGSIGEILQQTLIDLPKAVIAAPNAYYTSDDRAVFRKFKLIEKINLELQKVETNLITLKDLYNESILQKGLSN